MSRPRKLPSELYDYDFEALTKKEPHARTRVRYLGMMQLCHDKNYDDLDQNLKQKC